MTTKRNKTKEKGGEVIRSRVDKSLRLRLTNYRRSLGVTPSEGFVVRQAMDEFLKRRETEEVPKP